MHAWFYNAEIYSVAHITAFCYFTRKLLRPSDATEELDAERAGTLTSTSWPLMVAAPLNLLSSFIKPLSRDTDGCPNIKSLKAATPAARK